MALSPNSIITPQQPRATQATVSLSNGGTPQAPTNASLICTAGPNGARLTRLWAIGTSSLNNTQIQLYRSSDAGVNKRMTLTALMTSYTAAGNTLFPISDFGFSDAYPLQLGPGEQVYVTLQTTQATQTNFFAELVDY